MSGGKMSPDESSKGKKQCYFYVVIPPEDQAVSQDHSMVVHSTTELMAIMKRNPRARFQSASSPEEAERKAMDIIQFTKEAESVTTPKNEEVQKRKGRQSFSAVEESIGSPAIESPKTGELLMTGREIMTKQNEKVFERISKNPRLLCTDTEFPTILQEGCKYNAAHIAAKADNFEVLRRILDLVSCTDFLRQIYPKQNEESLRASCKHLVLSYLNNPDKMMQDTPLHFACKFNAVKSVELLLSHPFCDTSVRNFENKTPYEVIGERDTATRSKAITIKRLFNERYIVPIWRDLSVDGEAPVLGKVCFIYDLGQDIPYPLLQEHFPNFSLSLLPPCKDDLLPNDNTPKDCDFRLFVNRPSNWKIRGFAGPVTEERAVEFRRLMKRSRGVPYGFMSPDASLNVSHDTACFLMYNITPPPSVPAPMCPVLSPRAFLSPIRPPPHFHSFYSPIRCDKDVRVRDIDKGLERMSFEYCVDLCIPWSEYWHFLGKFCNLCTEDGLDKIEAHLIKLEAIKRETEIEDLIITSTSTDSADLNDIISQFREMRLNSSGLISPRRDIEGYCTNARCRMNERFCNCAEVVPPIPYDTSDDFSWMYEKIENAFRGVVPPSTKETRREPKCVSSSESPSGSFDASGDIEFPFQLSEYIPDEYETAPSSPADNDDVFEDCNGSCVFLSGEDKPGKCDRQVYLLLKDFSDNITSGHLRTFQWLNSMRAYGNTLKLGKMGKRNIVHEHDLSSDFSLSRLWEPSFGEPSFVSTPRKGDSEDKENKLPKHFNFNINFSL